MTTPNFRNMPTEEFDAYIPMTDEIQEAHEIENKFREWCKEENYDPMDSDSRDIYEEQMAETGQAYWDGLSPEERQGAEDDMHRE